MAEFTIENEWTEHPSGDRIFGNFIESGFGRQVNSMWAEMLYNRGQPCLQRYVIVTEV